MADTTVTFDIYREKWREAPRGSDTDGRVFSSDLLALPDDRLLDAWNDLAARRYGGELGWLGPVYNDALRDRRVLELGSGLGYDGIRFAEAGAHWTFADIVHDNLELIRRIARLKGIAHRTQFHYIADDLSFAALPADYDAIWVFGSIHHVPFEIARREALDALGHLRPGGRWMELVYPRERWLREGAPPFDQWGKQTDGDRTPWAEWHDAEKIKRRLFPAPMRTVLDFEFCAHNYRWIDLVYDAASPFRLDEFDLVTLSRSVDLLGECVQLAPAAWRWPWSAPWQFTSAAGIFTPAAAIDLGRPIGTLRGTQSGATPLAIDLECRITRGGFGIGLVDSNGVYLPDQEFVLEAKPDSQLVTLRARADRPPSKLVIRNMRHDRRGALAMRTATLRVAP
jgi:SAM-dependent methyltransferase